MFFQQYVLSCLSQLSYLVGDESTGRAVVVDPHRDVSVYLQDAIEHGLRIERVIETHVHADFLSGHLELAAHGAAICYGEGAQTDFDIESLADGQRIDLGEVQLEIRATPGHTPESISVVICEHRDSAEPFGVLTGDALFIGDVGRPDLLGSAGLSADQLARQLYRSLHEKILTLPDGTRVFPAHGAGSACGKNLSSKNSSTIAEQRVTNYALAPMSEDEFVAVVTEGQPIAPPYFSFDGRRNREQRPLLDEQQSPEPLSMSEVLHGQADSAVVLDTREPADFAAGHLRGSVNVGLGGRFAEWAGDVLRPDQDIVLVCEPGRELEAKVRLGRIGFDNVRGHLAQPFQTLLDNPELVQRSSRLTASELAARRTAITDLVVVDVRNRGELERGAIPGSVHIPLPRLLDELDKFDRDRPTVVHCASGYRSVIAASLLTAAGLTDVSDLLGGYESWASAPRSLKTRIEGESAMALFVVRHQHTPSTCPAGDPDAGAMMLNHLSRSNVRQHGIEILGEAVVKGEHTFYMIVQAPDEASVATFMQPFARVGTAEVYPASTCAKVITSGGCTVEAPASSPDVMDPEEACQRAIEAGLVVHCAHPLNGETSIPALIGGVVMPSAHFYVRNHFHMPMLNRSTWRLQVGGLTDRRLTLSLRDLQAMPSQSQVVTLECAGNNRTRLSPPVAGEQWRLGAVSTAEWTGVPLVEVLDRAGITSGACELVFRGADAGNVPGKPEKIRFERGLSIAEAGDSNALLAYAMNGEPLPIQHGYPLRLVVPGWYGVASVKWLSEIEAVERPFDGFFQVDRYTYEWTRNGQQVTEPVTLQRVRALITEPAHEQELESSDLTIRGVAWSGAAPIARVDVSVDHGPWHQARLLDTRRRHSWQWWELIVVLDGSGPHTIRARATDLAGRTQPNEPEWNRLGYGSNAIQELRVHSVSS